MAIAAYVRVLQLSQGSQIDELPADVQAEVQHALASTGGHVDMSHGADHGETSHDDAGHGDSTHE